MLYKQINQKLESQLGSVRKSQEKLKITFREVLEQLKIEHQNLKTISTGLVNSASVLLKKQKQLLVETEAARKFIFQSVVIAWILPIITLIGWLTIAIII